ncbi:2744_t:CDS:2, partial [Funneliformis geosporum]
KIRTLMTKLKNSTKLCDQMQSLCSMHNLEYKKPEIDMKVRWNSTYNMLMKSHEIRIPLQMLASQTIYQIIALLEPMEKGTRLLCATNYPTLALVHCVFNRIQYHLDNYIENNKDINLAMIASSMKQKISEYWSILDKSSIVATILDP